MNVDLSNIFSSTFTLLAGGVGAILVKGFFDKPKVKVEMTGANIETAMQLNEIAVKRYTDLNEKLVQVEKTVDELRSAVNEQEGYIRMLEDLLIKNGIAIPNRRIAHNKPHSKKPTE
jgi:hypothetical protein